MRIRELASLVSVDKDDLLEAEGEEDVQEEDLVSPDGALLLRLLVEPARPLVLHVLVLEPVPLRVLGDEILHTHNQRKDIV